ncbi:MAG: serine hydrolase, partial [Actinomycetes bacterium]
RQLAGAQVSWRAASVAAGVVRDGHVEWSGLVGTTGLPEDIPPGPDTQLRIGSITKTFTAVTLMQCRDDGLLDLDDRLEEHLPGTGQGRLTLRRMLAHRSGLQREPDGAVWQGSQGPDRDELLGGVRDQQDRVLGLSWATYPFTRVPLSFAGDDLTSVTDEPAV